MSSPNLRRRLFASLAVALAVGFGASACVGIPSSGGVNAGVAIKNSGDSTGGDVPQGPRRGASKGDILTDFMQAATSPAGDYSVAKQFLTKGAARKWNPDKNVLIREGSATSTALPDGSIDYGVNTKAFVTANGVYTEDSSSSSQSLNFQFQKVDGQWRISSLGDQTVISRPGFEQVFAAHPVYFFDPTYHYLVPDVRWFPRDTTVQTRVVSALLGGPTEYLQKGAVVTAFPTGTTLEQPVQLTPRAATVDLSTDAAASTKNIDRARMQQQLETSLRSTNVTGVSISVHGAPLSITGNSSATPAVSVNNAPLVRIGKKFGFAPRVAAIGRMTAQIVAVDATAVTMGRDQTSAAVLSKGGAYLITNDASQPALVDARPHLIAPSIDPRRFVWSVPSTDASAIHATGTDGIAHRVQSTLGPKTTIVSLTVSHDGTRLLFYLKTSTGPKLGVAGILRNANGVPIGLGDPLYLPVASLDPIDATWVDDESVAALGRTDGGEDTVISYLIGGTAGDPASTSGAVHLAGGSSIADLRLLNTADQVQQLRSSGWQNIGIKASVLATQQ